MDKSDMDNTPLTQDEKLFSGVLLLNAKVLGLTLGLILGLGIFVATNWLVIKGGERVGYRLQSDFCGKSYRGCVWFCSWHYLRLTDGMDL